MKKYKVYILLLMLSTKVLSQETLINGSFSIRDFVLEKDSVFYIEKRDIKYHNLQKKDTAENKYFIGGYGLRVFNDTINNRIISVSNEFVQKVSSLRFYNKKTKNFEDVFYYKEAKSIEALLVPHLNYAVMSLTNNKIIIIDYSKKPKFNIIHQIELNSLSRSMYFRNGNLFYATDKGDVFKYNLSSKEIKKITSFNEIITNLNFKKNDIYIATLAGKIIKYNILNKTSKKLEIINDFVLNSVLQENLLICGTFKGGVYIVDTQKVKIIKELKYHKKSVLKIVEKEKNIFYSSSIDQTIKKWKLK